MEKYSIIHKNLGETPLEALERFRAEKMDEAKSCMSASTYGELRSCDDTAGQVSFWQKVPMTYAGRLDPMAEGELLILIGEECKNKEKYLGLDKEYEVEVLFGMTTDTHDILGLLNTDPKRSADPLNKKVLREFDASKYVGKFVQEYPMYSSKTVNGKQLHELARAGSSFDPEEMPTKKVEIYSIDNWGFSYIAKNELEIRILKGIDLVKGDFRQNEIKKKWIEYFSSINQDEFFNVLKLGVKCSSGTYMRKLAEKIGDDKGMGAIALSINRTHIFI